MNKTKRQTNFRERKRINKRDAVLAADPVVNQMLNWVELSARTLLARLKELKKTFPESESMRKQRKR